MKTINCEISNEAYIILSNFKINRELKSLGEALDKILKKRDLKLMKGGNKK